MIKSIRSHFLLIILFSGIFLVVLPNVTFSQTEDAVVEFALDFVGNSYDVSPKTVSITDPYTNETTTTIIASFHVENKTIVATIKNNLGASYYNFRFKERNENEWTYYPIDSTSFSGYNTYDAYSNSVPIQASNSSYTVVTLPSGYFQNVPIGGEVDVQIQALFGDYRAVPYVHVFPLPPTYDFYFEGTVNDWSNTQTVTFEENAIIPEFHSLVSLFLFLVATCVVIAFRKRIDFKECTR